MFPRRYVALCPRCNEVTPHEDHRFGRWLSFAIGTGAAVFVLLVGSVLSWAALLFLTSSGMWIWLDRHEQHPDERCTRCRHKTRPTARASR